MTPFPPPADPSHTSVIWHWILGAFSGLSALSAGVWTAIKFGFTDYLKTKFWDKMFKPKEDCEKPLTHLEFLTFKAEFKSENEVAIDRVERNMMTAVDRVERNVLAAVDQNGRVVQAAALDVSNTSSEVREVLRLYDLKIDQKTGELHEKINATDKDLGIVQGQVDILKRAVG